MAIGDSLRDFFGRGDEPEYEANGGEEPENYVPQFELNVDEEGVYRDKETGDKVSDAETRHATGTERDANDGNGDRNKHK